MRFVITTALHATQDRYDDSEHYFAVVEASFPGYDDASLEVKTCDHRHETSKQAEQCALDTIDAEQDDLHDAVAYREARRRWVETRTVIADGRELGPEQVFALADGFGRKVLALDPHAQSSSRHTFSDEVMAAELWRYADEPDTGRGRDVIASLVRAGLAEEVQDGKEETRYAVTSEGVNAVVWWAGRQGVHPGEPVDVLGLGKKATAEQAYEAWREKSTVAGDIANDVSFDLLTRAKAKMEWAFVTEAFVTLQAQYRASQT